MVGSALQKCQRTAIVFALSMTAADGDLRHALPEAAVPIVDTVRLPGALKELVGLEKTSLVEQRDSSPASFLDGDRDLFRFFGVDRFIPASVRKRSTVPIAPVNAAWEQQVLCWASIHARADS
jgi:hypothetical protein